MSDPGQVWPVQPAGKPACGVRGHRHPQEDYTGCVGAIIKSAPGMRTPDGRNTALGQGLADEVWARDLSELSAFHRGMCEVPYTSFRDVDKAREIGAAAEARAAEYRRTGLLA